MQTLSQHPLKKHLPQPPSLTLRLEEAEDVILADGALDVSDDGPGLVIHELDTDLGNTSTGTYCCIIVLVVPCISYICCQVLTGTAKNLISNY